MSSPFLPAVPPYLPCRAWGERGDDTRLYTVTFAGGLSYLAPVLCVLVLLGPWPLTILARILEPSSAEQ